MLLNNMQYIPRAWLMILAGGLFGLGLLSTYQLLRGFQVDSHGVRLVIPRQYYFDRTQKKYTFDKKLPTKQYRFAVRIPSDDWQKIFADLNFEEDPWGRITFYILTYPPSLENRLMRERVSLMRAILNKTGLYQQVEFEPSDAGTYHVYKSDNKKAWDMLISSPTDMDAEAVTGDERIGYCAEVTTKEVSTEECYLQFHHDSMLVSLKVPLSYTMQHKQLKRTLFTMIDSWRN